MNPSLVLTTTQKKIRFKRSLKKQRLSSNLKSQGEVSNECNWVDVLPQVNGEQLLRKTNYHFQDGLGIQLGDCRKYSLDDNFFRATPIQAAMSNSHSISEGGENGNFDE